MFVLLSVVSCQKDKVTDDGGNSRQGVVKGIVTDTQGRPVKNATIVVNNTVWYDHNIVLSTGADGKYSYDMPATDSWYVRGSIKVQYHNYLYELPLCPDYAGAFPGVSGKEVNLQWKLTGPVPTDFGGAGYYGGSAIAQPGFDIFDLTGVELTLVPQGLLIDGSTGNTIVKIGANRSDGYVIEDIPIGRYTITAKLNGQTLYLRKRPSYNEVYATSITADFEPTYPGATSYAIQFDVNSEP